MKRSRTVAFTIIELLVVVSIIALLIGILLPAIGKARDQARLTISEANLRNLATAHQTYAAEWSDRQFTLIDDNLASYGQSQGTAYTNWKTAHSAGGEESDHPPVLLGWRQGSGGHGGSSGNMRLWGYWMSHSGNWGLCEPMVFPGGPGHLVGFGAFRIPNAAQFNQYVGGRYYDPVFYAPKDTVVLDAVGACWEDPGEFCLEGGNSDTYWSSYCNSPAGMFSPDVMRNVERGGWQDPYLMPGGFRSPSFSQALYPSLKTHMIEHHWLQQKRADCNGNFTGGTYNDCEPYYFNHGWESVPMALFYDGHIESLGVREAEKADRRHRAQTGNDDWGLWSRDTSFGDDGYFIDLGYDFAETSFHVLTTDGIRGRDKLGDG